MAAPRPSNARSELGLGQGASSASLPEGDSQLQMDVMQRQDEQLEHLALDVKRIGEMGKGIHEELEDQSRLLDQLDDDFSNTRSNMAAVHTKVRAFIQETGRGQLCTIVGLYLLFLVLLFLLLTT